jgi:hypothetical protein
MARERFDDLDTDHRVYEHQDVHEHIRDVFFPLAVSIARVKKKHEDYPKQ